VATENHGSPVTTTPLQHLRSQPVSVLEFIAAVVWPLTILIIALLFRPVIIEMLSGRVSRMKAGPFEVEMARTLAEVETDLPPTAAPVAVGSPSATDTLRELAERAPEAAVMEGFRRVELALLDVLRGADAVSEKPRGVRQLAREALERGLITPETAQAIEGLAVLRNMAAHGRSNDVSPARAKDYLALVDAVLFALRAGPRPGDGPTTE
jgi:hypothetical protein